MKKNFSLQPVRDLAQRKTDAAAAALAQLKKLEAQARQTLQMLEQCRDDYVGRLDQALSQGIGPGELRNFREFMSKLDRAIAQQGEALGQAEARSHTGMLNWQAQTRKLKSFDVLAAREGDQLRRQEQRLEQKQHDEQAATGYRRTLSRD